MSPLATVTGLTLVVLGCALLWTWLPHVVAWLEVRQVEHLYRRHLSEWQRELSERRWARVRAENAAARREIETNRARGAQTPGRTSQGVNP